MLWLLRIFEQKAHEVSLKCRTIHLRIELAHFSGCWIWLRQHLQLFKSNSVLEAASLLGSALPLLICVSVLN